MKDKERLEDIKEQYHWAVEGSLPNRISDSDIDWLIEQAELGLMQQNYYHDMQNEILKLRKENKRMTDALFKLVDRMNV